MMRLSNLFLAVVVGSVALLGVWLIPPGKKTSPQPSQPSGATFPARVQQQLHQAHLQTTQAIEKSLGPVSHLFTQAKQGTRAFAEEVLSLRGKWYYLTSSKEEYEKYLQEQFIQHVLAPDDLKKAVTSSFVLFEEECQNIENLLFVSLRADVPDLGAVCAADAKAFSQLVEQATVDILRQSGEKIWESLVWDTGVGSVAVFIGEEVIVYIITQVAQRAGLLAFSTAASWETLGLSIVVGFILDWIWDWWSDPQGELADELNKKLDRLHQELYQELQHRMQQMANARHKARVQMVEKAFSRAASQ